MTWLWLYLQFVVDQEERHEFARDYSIFVGSFHNPEAAQEMMSKKDPQFDLSDEEFDESMQKVIKSREEEKQQPNILHRRKRKVI